MDEEMRFLTEFVGRTCPKEYCRRQHKRKAKPKPASIMKELSPKDAKALRKLMRILMGEPSEKRTAVIHNLLHCQDETVRLNLRLKILEDMTRGSLTRREKARLLSLELAPIVYQLPGTGSLGFLADMARSART